jgi:predicted GNAT family acetyltransferase
MLQIREYQPEDEERVKRLVLDLKKYYPGIEDWMNKEVQRIESKKSKCLVVVLENEIGGVAISAMTKFPKKNDVVKLKKFYLSENFREYGLGPYLLERVIDEWVKEKAKKIYVTFAEEEIEELKSFFDAFVIGKVTRYPKKIPIDIIRSEIKPSFDPQGSCFISQKELDTIRKLEGYEL